MWKLSGCLHTSSFISYSTKLRSATVDYAFSVIYFFLSPSSVSGTTIIYCLYFCSFSIHFRDHLAIILNVTIGFLSLFYLFPFYLPCSLFYSTCSFFALLVPFGPGLYKFACLFYTTLSIFFIQACIFLSTLCLFYPKPLSKKTQPSVSFALIRAHFYICLTFLLSPFHSSLVLFFALSILCFPKIAG